MTDDVCRQVYKIKNEVFVFNGQIKGQTLLPIPAGMENYEQDKKFELSRLNIFYCFLMLSYLLALNINVLTSACNFILYD